MPTPVRHAVIAALALGGCSKNDGSVQVLNGFDFPVTVTLVSDADGEQSLSVPARGRVGTEIGGKGKFRVATEAGVQIAEDEVAFGKKERNTGCYRVLNVAGAAAVVSEDVVYGTGLG